MSKKDREVLDGDELIDCAVAVIRDGVRGHVTGEQELEEDPVRVTAPFPALDHYQLHQVACGLGMEGIRLQLLDSFYDEGFGQQVLRAVADEVALPQVEGYPIINYFKYDHLPPHLQEVSRPFCVAAHHMAVALPRCAETTAGLRKLLEAKDCAVRAKLTKPQSTDSC